MRRRKIDNSSHSRVGHCQTLCDADMDPNLRAVLMGLTILIIAFGSALGARYLF